MVPEQFKRGDRLIMEMIPQFEPWLGEEELAQVAETIRDNWITGGKKTKEFDADTLKACKAVLEDVARGKDDAFNAAISLHNIFKIPPYTAYKITRKIEEKSR